MSLVPLECVRPFRAWVQSAMAAMSLSVGVRLGLNVFVVEVGGVTELFTVGGFDVTVVCTVVFRR